MRCKNYLVSGLLLALALLTPDFVMAAGNSINDTFDALANSKGGSKTSAAGLDAFDDMAKGKGSSDAGTGHGIDAGLQTIEANRAEKKARIAEEKRIRMEELAKKQDQDMNSDCYCAYNNCLLRAYRYDYKSSKTAREQEIEQAAILDEADRQARPAREAKKRVCDEWKAAGPKANSESFKAQLRQQDAAIAAAKRGAEEAARQRDAMIEADIKQRAAQEESARIAKRNATEDAEKSRAAAQAAKAEAAAAEGEEKRRQACMEHRSEGLCECMKYYPKKKRNGCNV